MYLISEYYVVGTGSLLEKKQYMSSISLRKAVNGTSPGSYSEDDVSVGGKGLGRVVKVL